MGDVESEVQLLETNIRELKKQVHSMEFELAKLKQSFVPIDSNKFNSVLTTNEITRYSRQILVPDVNVAGQALIKKGKVLIVGCGGLGSPCALYLAAVGVGEITLVDGDQVDLTNLHRQILHNESKVGSAKVDSAYENLRCLNSTIKIIPLEMHLNSTNVEQLFRDKKFDVVVDGTDNVATRYLLNDACVFQGVPLVSGSALQMEGQLTVYNFKGGPCYRCIFPKPPPPEAVNSCGDSGVVGPVPGVIGTLQALEALKILTKQLGVLSGRLLTFDGSDCTFRNIQLRGNQPDCEVCGQQPSIKSYIDYEQFCGAIADDKTHDISILKPDDQVNVSTLNATENKMVIDVRPEIEFKMCHLPKSINIPYSDLLKEKMADGLKELFLSLKKQNVFVICRRGNDSQKAVCKLNNLLSDSNIKFLNVRGGLRAYSAKIDAEFPIY